MLCRSELLLVLTSVRGSITLGCGGVGLLFINHRIVCYLCVYCLGTVEVCRLNQSNAEMSLFLEPLLIIKLNENGETALLAAAA